MKRIDVALVLSPSTVLPLVLSPSTVPPLVLSPSTVPPLVLSPSTVPPLVLSPSTVPPLVLSPSTVPPLVLSPSYGLQSRRRPFESSLKPTYGQQSNGGYGQQSSNGGYSQQFNGGYSQQSNGGYSQQSSGGYSQQSSGGYGQQSNGGYGQQSSGSYGQQSNGGYGQQSNGGYGQTEPPTPYSFSYDVLDVRGNDFGAAEESNGEEVQGQYSVVLPDGRLQTVSYSVQGDSGFVADLEYEGEAKFLNAYGEEEGRSNVKRGRGPTGGQGYGSSQGPAYDVLDVRGNDFGAAEESNGEEVQGQYSVVLPDGRLQTVSYSVQGDSGFVADVEYEGEAKFFNAYGEEEGRSNVKRGRGPTGEPRDSPADSLPSRADFLSLPSRADFLSLPIRADFLSLPSRTDFLSLPSRADFLPLPSRDDFLSLRPLETGVALVPNHYDVLDVPGNVFGADEEANSDSGFVADVEYEGEVTFFNAYREEEGRSNVKRGRGPTRSYGLQSRRRPFESSLKPTYGQQSNGGYGQESSIGGFGRQSNEGYSQQSNGGYSQQSNGGYSQQSGGGYSQHSNGGYGQQSNGGYSQQSNGGYGQTEPPTPYSFSYDVLDVRGNDFGAAEESNGEEVQGQYSVVLPDGRLQTVSYSIQGDSGFVADVEYEGEAKFLNAYGEEEGRSNVKRGRGPTGGQGYGSSQGSAYGK
ncbi:RNA-binding protein FUS-like [Pollicipes pollicipes]|uniref:RNA-binding protein FUS-like n=1 Tax=Pollicipes pollicipes TaxID=41117 RepID=UPI0018857E20|nr:RNA-binding protein FUS-like [Pollicipes pollicipes]